MIEVCDPAGIGRPVSTTTGGEVTSSVPRHSYRLTPDGQSIEPTVDEATILETLARRRRHEPNLPAFGTTA